jgi:hypothetical protein
MDVTAAVMNVITFKAAYSLYPRATFEECTSLLMTNNNSSVTIAVAKYCLRGWTFTCDPKATIIILEKCETSMTP